MVVIAAGFAPAQARPNRLTFDVAVIKRSQPSAFGGGIKPMPNGNGYVAQNLTVRNMMAVIYRLPDRQIVGGPAWFDTEAFDVEARADGAYDLDDLHTMFKNLLADRFALKFHTETREGPVYALTVAKSGVKMKPDGSVSDLKVPVIPRGPGDFVGTRVPMQYLCFFLGQQMEGAARPVVDRTGLTDVYDFTLTFIPEFPGVSTEALDPTLQNRPTLFDAVQEQLGLKLESARGPVDEYVIDHVQQPSAN
jgi:uncharacterized protein (TIGR03435 family)